MDDELHLPWDSAELETLIRALISRGEAAKIDLKSQFDLSGAAAHGELLKDVSAIANTFNQSYRNHGFIVLGAGPSGLKFTTFPQDADHLQASIDELVKNYIEPFVPTRLFIFGKDAETWGVLVVPPTRNAPHVFVKDIHKRYRGDIYVRRGTITDKALPADYFRFFAQHLDEHTYEQKVALRELAERVAQLERIPAAPQPAIVPPTTIQTEPAVAPAAAPPETGDLLQDIERELRIERDAVVDGLIKAAQEIRSYLRTNDIPWALQVPSKEAGEQLLQQIEDKCRRYWQALAKLAQQDKTGKYDEAIVTSLSLLAERHTSPVGLTFTDLGLNLRYYPLIASLYAVFVAGAASGRVTLLGKVAALSLSPSNDYDEPEHIGRSMFYLQRADVVFQTQTPGYPQRTWCNAVAVRIKAVIEGLIDTQMPSWKGDQSFFAGEFLLSLVPLDMIAGDGKSVVGHPASGGYLYYHVARTGVTRFLAAHAASLEGIFKRSLRDILADFDNTASHLVRGGCFGEGFTSGAVDAAYPDSAK